MLEVDAHLLVRNVHPYVADPGYWSERVGDGALTVLARDIRDVEYHASHDDLRTSFQETVIVPRIPAA